MQGLLAVALVLFLVSAANAQTLSQRPVSQGAVTPAGLMTSDDYLQADFAVRRNNFNLYKLPGAPPDFVKADNNPMPAKDTTPNMPALLTREYQGFELPASLR